MLKTNRIKKIDESGKIVIPQQILNALNLKAGDGLEFFIEKNMIILKEYKNNKT